MILAHLFKADFDWNRIINISFQTRQFCWLSQITLVIARKFDTHGSSTRTEVRQLKFD